MGHAVRITTLKRLQILTMILVIQQCLPVCGARPLELGDWYCIGPFKDEEFGNVERSLAYRFAPELDAFRALGIDPDEADDSNLALLAKASSPDNVREDRAPEFANDGNPNTYWDKQDHGKLYVLRLDWTDPVEFNAINLSGFKHHSFSPKAFTLVAGGRVIAREKNAIYCNNQFELRFESVKASQLDLRIDGYYGQSPAVREVSVYKKSTPKVKPVESLIDPSKTYRMMSFPGYLDLDRTWQVMDWSDGFYNLLPRGPAPSRNETVYMYRTMDASTARTISVHTRMQDFYKIWLNGQLVTRFNHLTKDTRYNYPAKVTLDLIEGRNHLLIKNTSRWAEHGFSFGIEGVHEIEDNFYYDINHHRIDTVAEAENYIRRFKFAATPIPMHSPAQYALDEALDQVKATPGAAAYDRRLAELEQETRQILKRIDAKEMADHSIVDHARRLYGFLGQEVEALPPIVFVTNRLYASPAIAPYDSAVDPPSKICCLDPAQPGASPRVIFHDPDMAILDMGLSYDAKTLYFSARQGTGDPYWQIYRIGVDGTGLRQLTHGKSKNISPCELPSGRVAFVSTRKDTFVGCQTRYAGLLYTMASDGSDVSCISANIDSDHTPRVTHDGRILFTRWDYGIEKNVFARHGLWTVNPDGTTLQLVFGNTIEDPGGLWNAQPIPGRPELLTVFGPHHNHQAGMIGLVWNGLGPEAPRGTGYRWVTREVPIYGDLMYPDGYQNPYPHNEKQFIASYGGIKSRPRFESGRRPYDKYAPLKIIYVDAYGNERIIYEAQDGLSCYHTMLLQPREMPNRINDRISRPAWSHRDPEKMNRSDYGANQTATLLVQDVTRGISKYVNPGEAKYIAVMEQLQKSRMMAGGEAWGHTPIIGRGTVHARRLIGLVPIEEDGSAYFTIPATRSVSLNVLNAAGKTLMRMGSDLHVMPNETLSCIGCHEVREHGYGAAPPVAGTPLALKNPAVTPAKQGWGTQGLIDYATVVQPVWDKHCIRCHSGPRPEGQVNMTGDKTRFFNQSYDHLIDRDIVDHLSVFSLDHDEGTPKTVGAMVSRIDTYMDKKHCGSDISWQERFRVYCWIDGNVPYYATYDYRTLGSQVRGIGARDAWESKSATTTWANTDLQEVFDRRCAACHKRNVLNQSWYQPMRMDVYSSVWGDKALTSHGFGSNKWKLVNKLGPEFRINLTHPAHSLFLQAPLSADANGFGLCVDDHGSPVFKDTTDADYQKSLAAIETGSKRLKAYPRIDMMGRTGFMNMETKSLGKKGRHR